MASLVDKEANQTVFETNLRILEKKHYWSILTKFLKLMPKFPFKRWG